MKIMITGGTGFLGKALVAAFTRDKHEVTVVSRDPHKQEEMRKQYPNVKFVLADICNYDEIYKFVPYGGVVVHAAALKRVETGERAANEYVRVNIDGTRTMAKACINGNVKIAVFVGSDKQVSSANLYGMTKAVGERIWLGENGSSNTMFVATRYGNVMGSTGSLLTIWDKAIKNNEPLVVRVPEPTRFFMTINDAVQVITDAIAYTNYFGEGDIVFVPSKLKAFSVCELAKFYAGDSHQIEYVPLGAGEKQHEILLAPGEKRNGYASLCRSELIAGILSRTITIIRSNDGVRLDETPPELCSATAPRMSPQEVIDKINEGIST